MKLFYLFTSTYHETPNVFDVVLLLGFSYVIISLRLMLEFSNYASFDLNDILSASSEQTYRIDLFKIKAVVLFWLDFPFLFIYF